MAPIPTSVDEFQVLDAALNKLNTYSKLLHPLPAEISKSDITELTTNITKLASSLHDVKVLTIVGIAGIVYLALWILGLACGLCSIESRIDNFADELAKVSLKVDERSVKGVGEWQSAADLFQCFAEKRVVGIENRDPTEREMDWLNIAGSYTVRE
ncbi:hypothetical protein BT63DRAFT_484399 [Microthyrium microscopicum]|uniref:Uncharacterized protein n=1 Tax=Microthyrium microscopicum TaxID=703497 RepID=A0A6A6TTC6_9PEZI|nr:hypothetical protein BT63DRAFT_484399 [Microthyrium microscopicum]